MQIGDLVWSRYLDQCMGIVLDVVSDETDVEPCYRVKWWWNNILGENTFESREYESHLDTVEEKCK